MDPRCAKLFEPVQIGPKLTPNRFAAVLYSTGHSHLMPNGHIGFRAMLAKGGWGIVSTGLTEIDLSNLPYERLWDDSDIPRHAAGNKAEMTKVQKGIIKDVLRGENSREQNADWLPAYFQFSAKAYTERGGVGVVERWKAVQDLFVPAL